MAADKVAWERGHIALVHEVRDVPQLHGRWSAKSVSRIHTFHCCGSRIPQCHVASIYSELRLLLVPRQPSQLVPHLSISIAG